jgi:hypothetical protein
MMDKKDRKPDFTIRINWDSRSTSDLIKKLIHNVDDGDFELSLTAKKGSLLVEILIFSTQLEINILAQLLTSYLLDLKHNRSLPTPELKNIGGEDIFPHYNI